MIDKRKLVVHGSDFAAHVDLRGKRIHFHRSDELFWDIAFNATLNSVLPAPAARAAQVLATARKARDDRPSSRLKAGRKQPGSR